MSALFAGCTAGEGTADSLSEEENNLPGKNWKIMLFFKKKPDSILFEASFMGVNQRKRGSLTYRVSQKKGQVGPRPI